MSYKEDMASLANSAVAKLASFDSELAEVDASAGRYSQEYQAKRRAEVESRKTAYVEKVTGKGAQFASKYEEAVGRKYALDGNQIDDADMKLLNSGVIHSQEDLAALVAKHKGNFTMTQILKDYAARNDIDILTPLPSMEDDIEQGRRLFRYLQSTLSAPESFAQVWSGSNFKKITSELPNL
jgi:hypothetical protein